ncbi:hypothetical protein FCV25MIE_07778 [Fagus crenata]
MAPNPKPHLGLIHILIFFLSSPCLSLSDSEPTVYKIPPQFELPSGHLPDSVTNYTLSSYDSHFFNYLVYYDTTITGKLSYGSITNLKRIQVQRFFLWFDMDERETEGERAIEERECHNRESYSGERAVFTIFINMKNNKIRMLLKSV